MASSWGWDHWSIECFEWEDGFGTKNLSSRLSPSFNAFLPGLLWNGTLTTTSLMVIWDSGVFQNASVITIIGTTLILKQGGDIAGSYLGALIWHSWVLLDFLSYDSKSWMRTTLVLIEFSVIVEIMWKEWHDTHLGYGLSMVTETGQPTSLPYVMPLSMMGSQHDSIVPFSLYCSILSPLLISP